MYSVIVNLKRFSGYGFILINFHYNIWDDDQSV